MLLVKMILMKKRAKRLPYVKVNRLSKNTSQIVSLVSGAAFDRGGSYVTSYQTIKIDKDEF